MKTTQELMQEEAVAEKAAAVQFGIDSFKWLYATGLALNGAGLLKVADASAHDFWNVTAGACFFVGLATCVWVAILGGQLAFTAAEKAKARIALLFDIEAGKAKPERLAELKREQDESEGAWAGKSRAALIGAFLLFSTGLSSAIIGKAVHSTPHSTQVEKKNSTTPSSEPQKSKRQ